MTESDHRTIDWVNKNMEYLEFLIAPMRDKAEAKRRAAAKEEHDRNVRRYKCIAPAEEYTWISGKSYEAGDIYECMGVLPDGLTAEEYTYWEEIISSKDGS